MNLPYNIIRPATRDEWLKCRERGIGSSEVATIMGANPYETPYALWRRKIGLDAPKQENFAMKAGHYLEDAVAQFWSDATERKVIKRSAADFIVQDKERPYLQASPDRTYWIGKSDKGILECKTTQQKVDKDDLPMYWFCQLQYQMGIMRAEQGSLAWLISARQFDYKDFVLVPDFYAEMIEEVEKFWTDNILGKKEPELVAAEDVILKYKESTEGKTIIADKEMTKLLEDLCDMRSIVDEYTDLITNCEGKIKAKMGDAEVLMDDNKNTLLTWKTSKPTERLDTAKLKAEYPEVVAKCMKTSEGSRRFLLKVG